MRAAVMTMGDEATWHGVTVGAGGAERCSAVIRLCLAASAGYLDRFDADDEADDHAALLADRRMAEAGPGG